MHSYSRRIPGDFDTSLADSLFQPIPDVAGQLDRVEQFLADKKTGQAHQIVMKLAVGWHELESVSTEETTRLGLALLAIDEHQLAEHFLRCAQRETPGDCDFLGSLGICRLMQDDAEAAMTLFKQSAASHLAESDVEGLLADLNNIVACSLSVKRPEMAHSAILELLENRVWLTPELETQIEELVRSLERCQTVMGGDPLWN